MIRGGWHQVRPFAPTCRMPPHPTVAHATRNPVNVSGLWSAEPRPGGHAPPPRQHEGGLLPLRCHLRRHRLPSHPGCVPLVLLLRNCGGASRSLASWNGAGSHKHNLLNPDGSSTLADPSLDPEAPTPEDAVSVQVQKGDAIFFDRRVRDF